MSTGENPHAGTGSVVLDIGGDVGALIVVMPPEMDGVEVEIIPTGTDTRPPDVLESDVSNSDHRHHHLHAHDHADSADHSRSADHSHSYSHSHENDDLHIHDDIPVSPPHVAVVGRPTPSGSTVHSLVYSALAEGSYDLYVRPFGRIHLTAAVVGGQVTETHWD